MSSNISPFIATISKCQRDPVFLTLSTVIIDLRCLWQTPWNAALRSSWGQGLGFVLLCSWLKKWPADGDTGNAAVSVPSAAGDCHCPAALQQHRCPPAGQATAHVETLVASEPWNCHYGCHRGLFQAVTQLQPNSLTCFTFSHCPLKPNLTGRTGERFLPTPDMGFTVFHHAIPLLDTLLCTLFSLKYNNVESDTALSTRAEKKYMALMCSPVLQYMAYLCPIAVCLSGSFSAASTQGSWLPGLNTSFSSWEGISLSSPPLQVFKTWLPKFLSNLI